MCIRDSAISVSTNELNFLINKIDLLNDLDDPNLCEDLICSFHEKFSRNASPDFFNVIEKNNYGNEGSCKHGNVRRLRINVDYGPFEFQLFAVQPSPIVEEAFDIVKVKYSRNINNLFRHSSGPGLKPRPGFVVIGFANNSTGRELLSISTTDKIARNFLRQQINILYGK